GSLERLERGALRAPVDIVLIRGADYREATLFGDQDKAGRIFVSERAKKDGVYDAEDRGVRADAQGECQDGDGGEGGRFEEKAEGVTEVLEERLHFGLVEMGGRTILLLFGRVRVGNVSVRTK